MNEITHDEWMKIFQDYEESKNTYICCASEYFSMLWSVKDKQMEIRKLAEKWIVSEKITDVEVEWFDDILFRNYTCYRKRDIRLEFLEYCMKTD